MFQVYIYEYDEDECLPKECPTHILPVAVLECKYQPTVRQRSSSLAGQKSHCVRPLDLSRQKSDPDGGKKPETKGTDADRRDKPETKGSDADRRDKPENKGNTDRRNKPETKGSDADRRNKHETKGPDTHRRKPNTKGSDPKRVLSGSTQHTLSETPRHSVHSDDDGECCWEHWGFHCRLKVCVT